MSDREASRRHPGTVGEVFRVFLRLGLTSFGGPVAHLGYFREAFVARRKWLDDDAYADLVALCQFLPGPASSQVGMAIGLRRAGYGGLLAAWFAFTMPSAVLLVAFAYGFDALGDALGTGWLAGVRRRRHRRRRSARHGEVAHPRCPARDDRRAGSDHRPPHPVTGDPAPRDRRRRAARARMGAHPGHCGSGVAALPAEADAAGASSADSSSSAATADAAPTGFRVPVSRRAGGAALTVCAALLLVLPALSALTGDPAVRLAEIFSRAGALVFGGGHVVLPLLETETVRTGLVDHDTFLAGYGAAQAVPGPLFTFAAFLGASTISGPSGILGASIALIAIFLPAALLTIGALPFWRRLHSSVHARRALLGVNAAVVGLLGAALFDPVFIEGVTSPATLAIAIAAFIALTRWNVPAWAVVLTAALIGWIAL